MVILDKNDGVSNGESPLSAVVVVYPEAKQSGKAGYREVCHLK